MVVGENMTQEEVINKQEPEREKSEEEKLNGTVLEELVITLPSLLRLCSGQHHAWVEEYYKAARPSALRAQRELSVLSQETKQQIIDALVTRYSPTRNSSDSTVHDRLNAFVEISRAKPSSHIVQQKYADLARVAEEYGKKEKDGDAWWFFRNQVITFRGWDIEPPSEELMSKIYQKQRTSHCLKDLYEHTGVKPSLEDVSSWVKFGDPETLDFFTEILGEKPLLRSGDIQRGYVNILTSSAVKLGERIQKWREYTGVREASWTVDEATRVLLKRLGEDTERTGAQNVKDTSSLIEHLEAIVTATEMLPSPPTIQEGYDLIFTHASCFRTEKSQVKSDRPIQEALSSILRRYREIVKTEPATDTVQAWYEQLSCNEEGFPLAAVVEELEIIPWQTTVQQEYRKLIEKRDMDGIKKLYAVTNMKPSVSEEDYHRPVSERNIEAVKELSEITGETVQLPSGDVQQMYREFLIEGDHLSKADILFALTGEHPALHQDEMQRVYDKQAEKYDVESRKAVLDHIMGIPLRFGREAQIKYLVGTGQLEELARREPLFQSFLVHDDHP